VYAWLKFYHASKHQDVKFKWAKVLQQKIRSKTFVIPKASKHPLNSQLELHHDIQNMKPWREWKYGFWAIFISWYVHVLTRGILYLIF